MAEIARLSGSSDWIDLDFVERERTPEPAMELGIQMHVAVLSLSNTISVLDNGRSKNTSAWSHAQRGRHSQFAARSQRTAHLTTGSSGNTDRDNSPSSGNAVVSAAVVRRRHLREIAGLKWTSTAGPATVSSVNSLVRTS